MIRFGVPVQLVESASIDPKMTFIHFQSIKYPNLMHTTYTPDYLPYQLRICKLNAYGLTHDACKLMAPGVR